MKEWIHRWTKEPNPSSWAYRKFLTRAKTLFYSRLAFLAVGLAILSVPRWSSLFGTTGVSAFWWYFFMITYSVVNYLVIEKGRLGRAVTFATLLLDLLTVVYMIAYSGGLRSPVLPTQIIYTVFFALLFPNPLAIVPPLLTLPIVAKIDTELPGRLLQLEDLFILVWYSAVNFIVVYVVVYLNEREDTQHNEIVKLQEHLKNLAVTEERNRLARDIHDGLGASLSSLIIQSEFLLKQVDDGPLREELVELKTVAEESMDELRRSLTLMKSDFDLVSTLEEHCSTISQRTGIDIDFTVIGQIPKLEARVQLSLFRLLQEALNNACKHSGARRVEVKLMHIEDKLKLVVGDNGKGFEYSEELRGHYGLLNMKERARQMNAKLHIDTAPGKGCCISLELPLPEKITTATQFESASKDAKREMAR
ncbi:MAG: sensor histidine kinase [Deltaproteobacteria bacterium]|nr:MAG: sensor histidine kinase [Deltaproteobacteria bacterium]